MTTYEIRSAGLWPDADFEMRAAPDGLRFEGYAAVFDRPSVPLRFAGVGGGREFREVIAPGAFTRTLNAAPDVTLRFQHDMTALPLARTRSGTMALAQDDRGLRVSAVLPDNEWGRPVRDAIARGDIGGMSFRFSSVRDKWTREGGVQLRTLEEVRLGPEVSVTDMPAYPDTSAVVRSALARLSEPGAVLTPDELELLAREMSARAAMAANDDKDASAWPCCQACGPEDDCCESQACPDGCTGCDSCGNTHPASEAVADNTTARSEPSLMALKRAVLAARAQR